MATANKIMLVSNRVELAKSYLLSQFQDKPNINALVDALVSELQELENVINDIQTVRTLDGSYGWWTDQIGNELDISRGNYADNDYKTAIKIAMSKQSASASVDDILRIVSLITSDTDATISNTYPYMLQLYSWLFCVSDSYDGLSSLAQLFPLNTRIRLVKHDTNPFTLGVAGKGFGSGATLCSLVYHKNGHSEDPRFVTTPTQDIPPPITSAPTLVSSPYIYGGDEVGETLSLIIGTYNGDDPLSYSYQWLKNGFDIAAATGLTYTLVSGDENTNISCSVTVSNAYGDLVVQSNSILISATIPPAATIESDLGLQDIYALVTRTFDNTIASSVAELEFHSDGTVVVDKNGTIVNTDWAVTPATGIGSGYKMYYEIIAGAALVGLNAEAHYTLSSNITLSKTASSKYNDVETGQYKFYIYEIANPANIVDKTITITAEIRNEL